jgi:hypothetical protein
MMTVTPEFRGRRILYATVVMALGGTIFALGGGGSALCVVQLIWLISTGLLVRSQPRAAMHLLWWGAITLAVAGFLVMISGFDLHHDSTPTELDDDAVSGPYFGALLVAASGSMIVWLGRRVLPPRVPSPVPPARVVD